MFLVYYISMVTVGAAATDWANDGLFGDGWHLLGIDGGYSELSERYSDAEQLVVGYDLYTAEHGVPANGEFTYDVEDEETLAVTTETATVADYEKAKATLEEIGEEPDPASHLLALAPHHGFYHSGISEILTLDPTIRQNPQALLQLCKGAFALGMREFSANVADSDLVRVTGYMIRKRDVARFAAEGSRLQTTCLGAEASELTGIRQRAPRVVAIETLLNEH